MRLGNGTDGVSAPSASAIPRRAALGLGAAALLGGVELSAAVPASASASHGMPLHRQFELLQQHAERTYYRPKGHLLTGAGEYLWVPETRTAVFVDETTLYAGGTSVGRLSREFEPLYQEVCATLEFYTGIDPSSRFTTEKEVLVLARRARAAMRAATGLVHDLSRHPDDVSDRDAARRLVGASRRFASFHHLQAPHGGDLRRRLLRDPGRKVPGGYVLAFVDNRLVNGVEIQELQTLIRRQKAARRAGGQLLSLALIAWVVGTVVALSNERPGRGDWRSLRCLSMVLGTFFLGAVVRDVTLKNDVARLEARLDVYTKVKERLVLAD